MKVKSIAVTLLAFVCRYGFLQQKHRNLDNRRMFPRTQPKCDDVLLACPLGSGFASQVNEFSTCTRSGRSHRKQRSGARHFRVGESAARAGGSLISQRLEHLIF